MFAERWPIWWCSALLSGGAGRSALGVGLLAVVRNVTLVMGWVLMKVFRVVVVCVPLLVTSVVVAGSAAGTARVSASAVTPAVATPSVFVRPLAHLGAGSVVNVRLRGLPPNTTVQFTQCSDAFVDTQPEVSGCNAQSGPLPSGQTNSLGRLFTTVTLGDPVYIQEEFGDPLPIYCRADQCRLFAVWTDAEGDQQVLASQELEFKGSPATIAVKPNSNLAATQKVAVSGSAYGADGRQVQVLEEACIAIIQGHGCFDQLPAVTTRIGTRGTFSVHYHVQRYLPDGTDCAGDIGDEYCQLTVIVLNSVGQPDYTFGDPTWGDPHGAISFAVPASPLHRLTSPGASATDHSRQAL
jgi:hypothetical protein